MLKHLLSEHVLYRLSQHDPHTSRPTPLRRFGPSRLCFVRVWWTAEGIFLRGFIGEVHSMQYKWNMCRYVTLRTNQNHWEERSVPARQRDPLIFKVQTWDNLHFRLRWRYSIIPILLVFLLFIQLMAITFPCYSTAMCGNTAGRKW